MGIRILLVDDHKIVCQAITSLLENELGMEVVGQAEDGRRAVELVRKLHPNVVVMDIVMPNLNGIEATRKIVHEFDDVRVIALSAHSDRRNVREMLMAGAFGYVPKCCAFEELVVAIRTVAHNQTYLSSQISGIVVEGYIHRINDGDDSAYSVLTPREREVLQLIAEGKSTKDVASKLHISTKTVETHRRQMMNKLDIHNIADLTKYAIRRGLTSVDFQARGDRDINRDNA